MLRSNIGFRFPVPLRFLVFGIGILVAVRPVLAQSRVATESVEHAVVACSERDSNLQRLECYDALAERLIQNSPRASAPRLLESSEHDDSARPKKVTQKPRKVSVEIESRREVRLKSGTILRPDLRLECGEEFSLAVNLGLKLPAGKVAVNTRVDRDEIVKGLWAVSRDRVGVVAPRGHALAARLKGGKILEVKVSPQKSEPIPFSFDLEMVHRECGDTIP